MRYMVKRIDFTPEMDELIRNAYLNYEPGCVTGLCKILCIDHHTIRDRADKLGLPKIQQYIRGKNRWTMAEINLLRKNETLTCRQLENIFKIHGYSRTVDAIDNYRRKNLDWLMSTHIDEFTHGYSTFQIRDMLGINAKTVHSWIKNGLLNANELECGNRRVKRCDLLKFMLDHPMRWNFKQMDTVWFADLINEQMRLNNE